MLRRARTSFVFCILAPPRHVELGGGRMPTQLAVALGQDDRRMAGAGAGAVAPRRADVVWCVLTRLPGGENRRPGPFALARPPPRGESAPRASGDDDFAPSSLDGSLATRRFSMHNDAPAPSVAAAGERCATRRYGSEHGVDS